MSKFTCTRAPKKLGHLKLLTHSYNLTGSLHNSESTTHLLHFLISVNCKGDSGMKPVWDSCWFMNRNKFWHLLCKILISICVKWCFEIVAHSCSRFWTLTPMWDKGQSWGFTSRSTARVILGQVLRVATCGTRTHRGDSLWLDAKLANH